MSSESAPVRSPPAKITYTSKAKKFSGSEGPPDSSASGSKTSSSGSPGKRSVQASSSSRLMPPPSTSEGSKPESSVTTSTSTSSRPPTTQRGFLHHSSASRSSPKRPAHSTDASGSEPTSTSASAKKKGHFRKPSLPTARFGNATSGSPPSGKPMSFAGITLPGSPGPSSSKELSPSTDREGSAAGSSNNASARRLKEPERLQVLQDDVDCEIIDPHRVKCKKCKKSISLGPKQTYTLKPWLKHRERCSSNKRTAGDTSDIDDAASTIAPSIDASGVSTTTRKNMSEADRKAQLLSDPRAEKVEPDSITCRKCQKSIRCSRGNSKYILAGWNKHQEHCSDISYIPGHRVATAERKLRLVNDSQAKKFTAKSVVCASCHQRVVLEGEGDYNLTEWDQHKAVCLPESLKESSARPPASTSSTEGTTAVGSEVALGTSPRGVKRGRDVDTEDVGEDGNPAGDNEDSEERPANRPRTESYQPSDQKPGLLGWFLMPFKEFARGFQEGLSPLAASKKTEEIGPQES